MVTPKSIKKWRSLFQLFCVCLTFFTIAKASDSPPHFEGWQSVGPSGGDVRSIIVDPKDKNHLFISTLDGQVYSSSDSGKSWRLLVNLNRPQLVLDQLMVDPRDSNVVYTSGHRHKDPGGFFKTTDGGATWKESKDLRKEAIHAMVQSAKDPNIIVVGTVNGVWISTNSGDDWKKLESSTAPTDIDSLAIDPTDTNIIYAGTWWRAYKTVDGGKNWKLIKEGMIDDSDVFAIDIDPRNPDHVVASACSGIYDSANKGEKWTKVNGIPSQSRRTRDILQHPSVAGTIYAGTTEGFWMTRDNGKTWALTTPRDLIVNSITVHPDEPNRVFIGTNNYGVMVSNDGGKNFVQTNGNFSSRLTYSITPDLERPNRLYATTINTATGGGFIFVSDDDGQTWTPAVRNLTVNQIIPYSLLQDRKNANTIYVATNVGIFRSVDRGNSWTQLTAPPVRRTVARRGATARSKSRVATKRPAAKTALPAVEPDFNHVAVLSEKVNVLKNTEDGKDGIFAATNKGLYRTYDLAKGWDKINFGVGIDQQVFAVTTSPQNPDTIWVGTATSGVIVSNDGGATWSKVSGVPEIVPIAAIAVDPQRPENIYVGTTQTFYLSHDGGKSWRLRGGGLPIGNYNAILINPRNPDEIFAGSSLESNGGIYQSVDAGKNWKRIDGKDANLASRRVWSMAFDPNNSNRIFAGTHSSGIFRIERTPATASNEIITRPRITEGGN